MSGFTPLQNYIEAAREGAAVLSAPDRMELGQRLGAALQARLGTLHKLDVALSEEPPFEFLIGAEVPDVGAIERGVAALQAWEATAGEHREWHAAWTDGPLLTLDVVLRTDVACTVGRVVLHPG